VGVAQTQQGGQRVGIGSKAGKCRLPLSAMAMALISWQMTNRKSITVHVHTEWPQWLQTIPYDRVLMSRGRLVRSSQVFSMHSRRPLAQASIKTRVFWWTGPVS
jgi:hypothetical protein